jgi:hypothetical protein
MTQHSELLRVGPNVPEWRYDWDAERRLIMDDSWPAVLSDAGYRAG